MDFTPRCAQAGFDTTAAPGHDFSTPKSKAEERPDVQSIASTARALKVLFCTEGGDPVAWAPAPRLSSPAFAGMTAEGLSAETFTRN
jgi:hypothetical protein